MSFSTPPRTTRSLSVPETPVKAINPKYLTPPSTTRRLNPPNAPVKPVLTSSIFTTGLEDLISNMSINNIQSPPRLNRSLYDGFISYKRN